MRAVEAASDALFRDESRAGRDAVAGLPETKPEQRRADAMGLIAVRAMAVGFGGLASAGSREGDGKGDRSTSGNGNKTGNAPISGSRAERYQVMLHVDAGTLKEDGDPGQSELEDGTRVSAETSRRVACDAGLVKIAHGPDGQVLGAGRRTRTVPPSVRRALEARDRGCRFPGCGLRFTDAHHVKHWADGGETSLRILVLLCQTHHRAVHEGGVKVCIDVDGQVVFFTPRGDPLFGAPPRPADRVTGRLGVERPGVERVEVERPEVKWRSFGGQMEGRPGKATLSPLAGIPRWKRDGDIPWEVEARAWEALDSG